MNASRQDIWAGVQRVLRLMGTKGPRSVLKSSVSRSAPPGPPSATC